MAQESTSKPSLRLFIIASGIILGIAVSVLAGTGRKALLDIGLLLGGISIFLYGLWCKKYFNSTLQTLAIILITLGLGVFMYGLLRIGYYIYDMD